MTRSAIARARIVGAKLAEIARHIQLAGQELVNLCVNGAEHSPRVAWLIDVLRRLGAQQRRAMRWVEVGV